MFKNKTEQNRNDEKYNQTDITVKIHTNHGGVWANMIMLKSIATRSSRLSLVITIKLASETTSATFRVKNKSLLWYHSDELSGKSHQSLQPSFASLSSRAIFMFRWIRLSVLQKTLALNSFLPCHVKKLACFYEPYFGWSSLNISLHDSVLEI